MRLKDEILITVSLSALVWSLRWVLLGLQPLGGDGPTYIAMACGAEGSPLESFHILTPRLAGFLSGRHPVAGFFGIAGLSFILASAATVAMLGVGSLRMAPRERLLGGALFMAVYPGVAMFRSYFLVDSLSYALLAVACAAAVHRREGVLALVTLVGIFNRETAFFVAPVWLLLNIGEVPPFRIALRSARVFGPAVVAYILLHNTPLFLGHYPAHLNYLRFDVMHALWKANLSWLGTENIIYGLGACVFLSYGPVWLLASYGYYQSLFVLHDGTRRLMLALGALALPTGLALSVVDWRRGFQPLFPAVIVSSVLGLRAITCDLPKADWYLGAFGTVLAANFTTEAWWSVKISVPVAISMSVWFCLIMFILLRKQFVIQCHCVTSAELGASEQRHS